MAGYKPEEIHSSLIENVFSYKTQTKFAKPIILYHDTKLICFTITIYVLFFYSRILIKKDDKLTMP